MRRGVLGAMVGFAAVFSALLAGVSAVAAQYSLSVSLGSLSWLLGQTNEQTVTVRNSGSATELLFAGISSLPHQSTLGLVNYFTFGGGTCPSGSGPLSTTLAPGQSCTLIISYGPGDLGQLQGRLDISYGPTGHEYENIVNLAGYNYAFHGLYTLDAYGGVHGNGCVPLAGYPYWPGWRIARAIALTSGALGGYVLDGYGGVHPFGNASPVSDWPRLGADIALDIKLLPGSTGGYVLDAFGGLHAFGGAPAVNNAPSWNWKAAKKIVILGTGSGGYVLDLYGGLHPFGVGSNAPPPGVATAYWPGQDLARDVDLDPVFDGQGIIAGATLDSWGGVHPFGAEMAVGNPGPRWPNQDVARAIRFDDSGTQPGEGWVLDKFGGLQSFAQLYSGKVFVAYKTVPVPPYPYWNAPLAAGMDVN